MKTKKELNEIKEEVENANKQRHALTDEELEQVSGGTSDEPYQGSTGYETGGFGL